MNVDIRAEVHCIDGAAGRCTRVVVNPTTLQMNNLVVKEDEYPLAERLVPLKYVISTDANGIKLDRTRLQFALMEEFMVLDHVQVDVPDYHESAEAVFMGEQIPAKAVTTAILRENIPAGELAIDSNTRVEAIDGWVGQVDELEVEQETGQITSLVMRTGHLWEPKGVAIPAALIDRLGKEAAFVKLHRLDIEALAVVPVGK